MSQPPVIRVRRPRVLGLTGSVGMGKTTTSAMFAEAGLPMWDADASAHALYRPGAAGVRLVASLFPEAVEDGIVNRAALRDAALASPGALARLEALIHPLVAADCYDFLGQQAAAAAPLVLLDVPLLFETGFAETCDAVVVVSVPPEVQRARVLARPGMTAEALDAMLARQMPDADKRARATHVIETTTLEEARRRVAEVVEEERAHVR